MIPGTFEAAIYFVSNVEAGVAKTRLWDGQLTEVQAIILCKSSRLSAARRVPEVVSSGMKQQVVILTTRLNLVPRSRMLGAIPPLSHRALWRACE
jgi:hypothetical protein